MADPHNMPSTVSGLRRLIVASLMVLAAALLVGSYFYPWWHFTLYAPQYPNGLRMSITLQGVTGDVREIDGLNHYIGMTSLGVVAATELKLAPYGIGILVALVLASTLYARRAFRVLVAVGAAALPLGFVADASYWLYTAGHELSPRAPIHLPAFTPQMFGNGKIGQFLTFASPSAGFWIACAGALTVLVAVLLGWRGSARTHRKPVAARGDSFDLKREEPESGPA